MSKFQDVIKLFADDGGEIKAYIPGRGYRLVIVESIDDDMVTIKPNKGNKVVLHYTAVAIERN